MYENPKYDSVFNFGDLEALFEVVLDPSDDFVLINCGNGREFMYYNDLDLMSIDLDGERYDLPKPKKIGDFVMDCERLEIELLPK